MALVCVRACMGTDRVLWLDSLGFRALISSAPNVATWWELSLKTSGATMAAPTPGGRSPKSGSKHHLSAPEDARARTGALVSECWVPVVVVVIGSISGKSIMALAEASSTEDARLARLLLGHQRSRPAHHEAAFIGHVEL
jgi:hypothetical protein